MRDEVVPVYLLNDGFFCEFETVNNRFLMPLVDCLLSYKRVLWKSINSKMYNRKTYVAI